MLKIVLEIVFGRWVKYNGDVQIIVEVSGCELCFTFSSKCGSSVRFCCF